VRFLKTPAYGQTTPEDLCLFHGIFRFVPVLNSLRAVMDTFFENLLACRASLYRYARSLSRDPSTAEDVVQETFRRGLSAKIRPSPETLDATRCWLFTIARHVWQNEVRRTSRYARAISAFAGDDTGADLPDVQLSRKLLQSEVRQAIEALPENHREVVMLRDIEGLSYSEIAAILSCPAGTVMSRLARARDCLRGALAPAGRDSEKAAR
jgi:RNA polymerase sigma-70 factor (ECF subfamily)